MNLRPQRLTDYVGQSAVTQRLTVALAAAQRRHEPLGHVLLYGPPGLGKTTLARVAAEEMGARFVQTSGPALRTVGEVLGVLHGLTAGTVVFIDEVHRLPRAAEEVLYPAMEDGLAHGSCSLDGVRETFDLTLPPFTLVAATTHPAALSKPFRDRFRLVYHLTYYSVPELEAVVRRSAERLGQTISRDACEAIAKRSRGTPRIANQLLLRVRDYANESVITLDDAERALDAEGVDRHGLKAADWRYLTTLAETYHGGPAGVTAIAATLGEDADTLEDVVEPYLLSLGLIARTPRGRVMTSTGLALTAVHS